MRPSGIVEAKNLRVTAWEIQASGCQSGTSGVTAPNEVNAHLTVFQLKPARTCGLAKKYGPSSKFANGGCEPGNKRNRGDYQKKPKPKCPRGEPDTFGWMLASLPISRSCAPLCAEKTSQKGGPFQEEVWATPTLTILYSVSLSSCSDLLQLPRFCPGCRPSFAWRYRRYWPKVFLVDDAALVDQECHHSRIAVLAG